MEEIEWVEWRWKDKTYWKRKNVLVLVLEGGTKHNNLTVGQERKLKLIRRGRSVALFA